MPTVAAASPAVRAPARRSRGVVYAVLASVSFSTGGLLVRTLAAAPDGFEIVFWRSSVMSLALVVILAAWHRGRTLAAVCAVGPWGVASAACLALTFFAFVLSLTRTTVANTTITMSLTPLIAALAGLAFLGERVAPRTWAATGVAGIGLAIMFSDSISGDGWVGILIALGVPLGLAANAVINRHHGVRVDMVPTVLVAGLLSLPLALTLAWPLEFGGGDLWVLAAMGLQAAAGCVLITLAMRHLPAAEIGLFTLLETVLGPLWVWLAYGEQPSSLALLGGALIVAALILNSLVGHKPDATSPSSQQ